MRFSDASADFDLEFVPAPACPPDAPPLPTRIYVRTSPPCPRAPAPRPAAHTHARGRPRS